jgi:hypothetical protein
MLHFATSPAPETAPGAASLAEVPESFPRTLLPAFVIVAGLAIATGAVLSQVWPGSIAAALVAAVLALQSVSGERRDPLSLGLYGLGALSAGAVLLEPGPLNLFMSWVTLALVAIRQRGASFHDLRPIALHLCRRAAGAVPVSAIDGFLGGEAVLRRLTAASPLRVIALPAAAVAVFAGLLMVANPVIDRVLYTFPANWPDAFSVLFVLLSACAFVALWPLFSQRMRPPAVWLDAHETPAWHKHYFGVPALVLTLALLNALFAVQNGLDLAFVWSDAHLPEGLTHAEYVHRGAYTLIATAILAGLLVMVALWPGSPGERFPLLRWLVYAFIAQNVLLVASSAARTLAYIDDYGLTIWRLAGLIWMGLVAAGLMLIVARIVLDRTTRWLVNQNLLAVFAVLFVSGFIDFAGIVANHNVERHMNGGHGEFDPKYLARLGPSALPALVRDPPASSETWMVRQTLRRTLVVEQADWRTWTLRGALIEKSLPRDGLQR